MRIAYRAMWLEHLQAGYDKKAESQSIALMLRHFTGPDGETLGEWARRLKEVFAQLAATAQRGIDTTEDLLNVLEKGKGLGKAKELVAALMRLDEEARVFSELNPPARPLILIARFERDNLEGADPRVLAKTTLDIYRACFARARLTEKKIDRIVEIRRGLEGG